MANGNNDFVKNILETVQISPTTNISKFLEGNESARQDIANAFQTLQTQQQAGPTVPEIGSRVLNAIGLIADLTSGDEDIRADAPGRALENVGFFRGFKQEKEQKQIQALMDKVQLAQLETGFNQADLTARRGLTSEKLQGVKIGAGIEGQKQQLDLSKKQVGLAEKKQQVILDKEAAETKERNDLFKILDEGGTLSTSQQIRLKQLTGTSVQSELQALNEAEQESIKNVNDIYGSLLKKVNTDVPGWQNQVAEIRAQWEDALLEVTDKAKEEKTKAQLKEQGFTAEEIKTFLTPQTGDAFQNLGDFIPAGDVFLPPDLAQPAATTGGFVPPTTLTPIQKRISELEAKQTGKLTEDEIGLLLDTR